jgi:hypothetical protein
MDIRDRKSSNWNTGSRVASRATILVILLNNDTVVCDSRESDVFVGNALDGSRSIVNSLDAYAILGVLDCGTGDGHAADGVVIATADGSDRKAVAAVTDSVCEGDCCAGVAINIGESVLSQSRRLRSFIPSLTSVRSKTEYMR